MLRNRDIVAAVLALILTRMAWNDQAENLSASIHLSFYFPFVKDQVAPAAFDVDGDGTAEALVTVKPYGGGTWVMQILDLKPLHSGYTAKTVSGAPFQPKELLRSEPITVNAFEKFRGEGGEGESDGPTAIIPLQIVTGQVMVRGLTRAKSEQDFNTMSQDERTKHYFCGDNWHDASSRCGTPCPSGTADECPDAERCYADTPCDATELVKKEHDVHEDSYHLTPAGGLPSCFTVWSNGQVTMHSLTSPKDGHIVGEDEVVEEDSLLPKDLSVAAIQAKLKRKLGNKKKTPLELKAMWTANSLPRMPSHVKNPSKIQLTFLDTFDAIPDARHGMVIVSGDLTPDVPAMRELGSPPIDPLSEPRFVVALDAMTGEVLWDSLQNFEDAKEEAVPLPVQLERGSSSLARRRSKIVKLDTAMSSTGGADGDTKNHGVLPNCLTGYRYSLLGATDALPYAYWGPADGGIRAVHLDHSNTQRKFHRSEQHGAHKHRTPLSSSTSTSQNHKPGETNPHHHHHRHLSKGHDHPPGKSKLSWHSALINPRKSSQHSGMHGGHVHYGRPNVVINYHAGGLHVHSLQNGQPLCHLSLLEESLYVDLQRDGVMDSIQVVTNGKNLVMDPTTGTYADPWVASLAEKVIDQTEKEKGARERAKDEKKGYQPMTRLCHALALSGINPSREELFSTPLCGTSGNRHSNKDGENQDHPWTPVHAAPPLVVESMYPQHRHSEKDVIFAMSNGVVSRIRGGTGRRQWKLNGKSTENFPSWGRWEATHTVSLTRLQVDDFEVAAYARPLLLVGESSMAILSATSANVLASTNIPQRSLRRPILGDVSGDGVTDVLVTTADAIWGYQIFIRTGASVFFRILVGLLLMGILLALLRNRYGGGSVRDRYKRSTDV